MTRQEAEAAALRVIRFLEQCGDVDVEAGVGALLGVGSDETLENFKEGIARAIREAK